MKNIYEFWVLQENLHRFLWVMSGTIYFDFSETDYEAILYGLISTDSDENIFYEHLFIGTDEDLYIEFARDGDWHSTDIIFITVKSNNPKTLEMINAVNVIGSLWEQSYKLSNGQ
ncbi:hypothetical protein [Taibaiella soli]|uniref:Uncharacterized protein n=1 Tax=Taibaiella soli TaxID=1649169 RepID=A0A2W2AFL3_9BACT|nr:hypothetical protein [Taibaiella soli]PZF74285.1 hypothetical protein DN068_04560 [Taibaiella soli]